MRDFFRGIQRNIQRKLQQTTVIGDIDINIIDEFGNFIIDENNNSIIG